MNKTSDVQEYFHYFFLAQLLINLTMPNNGFGLCSVYNMRQSHHQAAEDLQGNQQFTSRCAALLFFKPMPYAQQEALSLYRYLKNAAEVKLRVLKASANWNPDACHNLCSKIGK